MPLADYEGTYKNKMLGSVQVTLLNDTLQINFNDFITYSLEHWHYDTFNTNKDPRFYEKLKVNFDLNEAGKSSRLNIMGEVFTKKE